jgi:WD40 repeat protein
MSSLVYVYDRYQIATGSDDHTVRIWDLRKKNCAYTIPAHPSLVSNVRWQVLSLCITPIHSSFL